MSCSYFDAHCDTLFRCQREGWELLRNPGHLDLERLSAYRPMGQVFALYANSAGKTAEECFRIISAQAEIFRQAKAAHPQLMENCCLSLEGAELMGCDPSQLPMLKAWGVRWINLTWNHPNALGHPHTSPEGLTDLGKSFARKAEALGIYMDISHLSERGVWDLAEILRGPMVASHCNSKAICPHSRNISDAVAREIISRRGFIGLNLYSVFLGENPDIGTLVAHLEHFLALGGEDCIGLGSDFDGADALLRDIPTAAALPRLWEDLYRRNYSTELVEKLAYGNLAAFLNRPIPCAT